MDMSEEENAMLVALRHGNMPRDEDPIAKALEARGLVERVRGRNSWDLTPSGAVHVAEQDRKMNPPRPIKDPL